MISPSNSRPQTAERLYTESGNGAKVSCADEQEAATIFACIFVLPKDAASVIEILCKLTSNRLIKHSVGFAVQDRPDSPPEPEDSWLEHSVAADYLGISKSTLYHYAEQGKIESR